jgi:cell division protein ZapA
MPEVAISIGGRTFEVACQEGEEHYLHAAAKMLDTEARVLTDQIGRVPEARMLLMAGLMLADKTAAADDRNREHEDRIAQLQAEIEALKARPEPEPLRVEVPVIPDAVRENLEEIAARTEALAEAVEERTAASGD